MSPGRSRSLHGTHSGASSASGPGSSTVSSRVTILAREARVTVDGPAPAPVAGLLALEEVRDDPVALGDQAPTCSPTTPGAAASSAAARARSTASAHRRSGVRLRVVAALTGIASLLRRLTSAPPMRRACRRRRVRTERTRGPRRRPRPIGARAHLLPSILRDARRGARPRTTAGGALRTLPPPAAARPHRCDGPIRGPARAPISRSHAPERRPTCDSVL